MNLILIYKDVFNQIDSKTERLRFLLLLLFVFALPFDMIYSSLLMIGLTVTTLIDLNKSKLKEIPKQVWLFQIVFLLSLVGYFYSYHRSAAGFLLERQLNIFLFPLLLPLAIKINRAQINALLSMLAISCVIAITYLFVYMVFNITTELKLPLLHTVFSGVFFNHQFSRPIGIHAGYFSMYVALSIFYLIHVFPKKGGYWHKMILVLMLLVLFSGLFFLASRNTSIATLFTFIFIYPFFHVSNKLRFAIFSLVFLAFSYIAIENIPYLRHRFSVELISDIKPLNNGKYMIDGSAEPRYERWQGALELIQQAPLFGYGTGDEIEMLKTQYIQKGLFISYLEDFNAHNQYLSFLLKNGIIGLAVFLLAFYYYGRLAFKNRDFMYISFLILLLIGFYTENILDANKGILFFALFNTLFGFEALKASNSVKHKPLTV